MYVTDLECPKCKIKFNHKELNQLCSLCHGPLLVRYDLKSVKDNYYLISFKAETKKDKTFGSDFDKHIDVFLDCNQHSDRVEKAIMYTQLILNKKYGNEMTGEIMKQKKNDIREYFVKWI